MSGIKNKLKSLVSLMMIFAMIFTSAPSMADEVLDFTGTFQVFAGQNEEIGSAAVEIDDSLLTIHVTMEPDWPADAYSLYILEAEPTDRLNPGHAPEKNEALDGATDFTIGPIDLSLPELAPGQCLTRYLVLHIVSGTETAYPGDIIKPCKGPWYGYITVTICKPKTTPTGSITLEKVVVDSEGQSLTTDLTPFELTITHPDSTTTTTTITGNGTAPPITDLPLGTYTISEAVPEHYTLQSIQAGNMTVTHDLQITISEADLDHHVTVTNRKDATDTPDTWSLSLIKKVVDANDKPVTDTKNFDLEIKYPDGSLHTQTLKGDGIPVTLSSLDPGTYTITEVPPDGYLLKSLQSGDMTTDSALEITLSENDLPRIVEVTVTNQQVPGDTPPGPGPEPEPDPKPDPEPEPEPDPDPPEDTTPPSEPGTPSNPPEKRGEINVHKFLDTNQNNHQEPSEFDMQKITFELYAADKTTLLSTKKTGPDGDLTFTNLRYGTYYLREVSDYTITSPDFSADGFTTSPITINSTQALTFNVGNFRDTSTEDVPPDPNPPLGPPDEPPDIEIVEEDPPPLGAPPWEPPNTLPPTGEVPAAMLNLLGTLLLLVGAFLKYQY
ncbi:MSCRAMM family protein [Acidaminobacter hydrogenoformans]|uniref:Cna protein B-type domain-containing protein n=1 Tax=Acidaminobacter hydrogenoformans DSM 2784 TaxID=1120920 RepID=A0A1G5RR90_9FIRM|nr:prealbumin-like fold domain-containing protein [Acidaminobacter hydrogenoformans]SCZ76390.1 Cna protein B-type domain-containing protein [Acidaminobacter hydrogenoformans DSM 2784]